MVEGRVTLKGVTVQNEWRVDTDALVLVADENGSEIATLYVPRNGEPRSMGRLLKRIHGHFFYPPVGCDDQPVWLNTCDFAAWLTGYLKFYGTRRQPVANRTFYTQSSGPLLLPTGARRTSRYIYVLRPQASVSRDGWHVELTVYAVRDDGTQKDIFAGNLHKFDPSWVNGRGYSFLTLGL
jgi:hypothetical protein